jgi:two-component system, LytTR family, response regulator
MNALIVDDERLARNEMRRLLQSHPDVSIVGEAGNADEAEARLAELPVDLLFLDITMPGASGFDLLERLDRVPLLIFTTAYDEHALRAFEVNAFDYLLKPIRPERLTTALEKTRAAWMASRDSPGLKTRPPSDSQTRSPLNPPVRAASERVFLRDGDRCWFVTIGEIVFFEAEGNYARVHFGANRPLIRTSLNALESRLDPAMFFRASRQHIVNLRFIEGVDAGVDDSYTVRMKGGHAVPVSRRQSRKLRDSMGL